REQLERLWHVSNLYSTEPMEQLAERLSERFGGAHAFFCNSGTEAVEAAIKWARKSTEKTELVALEGSFHGRTMGALSITGQPSKRAPFEPLIPGARFATPETLADHVGPETAAIVLEPVQGAAACAVVDAFDDDLLSHVRDIGALFAESLPEVRGAGLLLAVELHRPAGPVAHAALEKGLLVGTAGDTALRITPPLTISRDEAQQGIELLRELIS